CTDKLCEGPLTSAYIPTEDQRHQLRPVVHRERQDRGRERLDAWPFRLTAQRTGASRSASRRDRRCNMLLLQQLAFLCPLNGVQEVAGSNPVAPTFARPTGTISSGWPFFRRQDSFRPQGQSCGQRFDRSVPPDTLPRPLDSWPLPSSPPYRRAGSTPS